MSTRILLTLFSALLVTSLGVGLVGMYNDLPRLMHSGVLGSISAATGLVCATLFHITQTTEAERAAEREAGYRLALQHVALGLLGPTPTGGTVVPIRREFPRQHERQAQ